MKNKIFGIIISIFFLASCQTGTNNSQNISKPKGDTLRENYPDKPMLSLAEILSKKEVPVLCYHHIRNFPSGQSERMKSYSVTPEAFAEQMNTLADSGYHTILPDQLYEYLVHGATLPSKPIMLSFDDTDEEQYTVGATEMNKHGFKGIYFVMTISINRPRYMSREQLKNLADSGHVVEAHTWDHHMVTKYQGADWDMQLVKPKVQLESITGKPIHYFAYPFGLWNKEAIPELKSRGYKLAFILSTKRDSTEPLFTVRRMIVPGTWSTKGMLKAMKSTFHI